MEVWLPWSKIFLTKGCRLIVCQVQNADLIAVSLACPKDPTSPYRMHMGPPRESSVRNLLEKVGNLRDIAVLVQLNLAFLTFIDLHLHSQTVSDYHPLFLNGLFQLFFFWMQWRGPIFSRSSGFCKDKVKFFRDQEENSY